MIGEKLRVCASLISITSCSNGGERSREIGPASCMTGFFDWGGRSEGGWK